MTTNVVFDIIEDVITLKSFHAYTEDQLQSEPETSVSALILTDTGNIVFPSSVSAVPNCCTQRSHVFLA